MQQHLKKAKSNDDFHQLICNNSAEFTDWKTVAVFYAALHYVRAYFRKKKIFVAKSHLDLNIKVTDNFPAEQSGHYLDTYVASRIARYEVKVTPFTSTMLEVQYKNTIESLANIKSWLKSQGLNF